MTAAWRLTPLELRRPLGQEGAYAFSVVFSLPGLALQARFVVEVIDQMDLSELTRQYGGRGSDAYHPSMMLGLLVYGYVTGVHSSRKIERACFDSVAFRFIAANAQPDHDSIAAFRRRFLARIERLFVQVLLLAREMKCLKLGNIALDGTKIAANASKHKAPSWAHANKIEAQLREEVQQLLKLAEQSDNKPLNEGLDVPAEIARREQRLGAIAQAKTKIEQRARERHAAQQRLCNDFTRPLQAIRSDSGLETDATQLENDPAVVNTRQRGSSPTGS